MKQILALLTILSLSMPTYAAEEEIAKVQSDFAKLTPEQKTKIQLLTQPVDAEFIKEIEEGIASSGDGVDEALILKVYMASNRFSHGSPFKGSQKELSEFRLITGLQEFITAQLAVEKPNKKVILTSATLYGSDPVISDRLLELYTSDNDLATTIIKALESGNLTDSKFKPVILQAIASDDANLACAAAQYLTDNPLPEALPALIKQYQRTNKDLDLKPVAVKPPSVQVDPSDVWRMLVGRAVRSYDRNALLEFEAELRAIEKNVTFGKMADMTYQGVLRKISK
jgi:hypothetical protein